MFRTLVVLLILLILSMVVCVVASGRKDVQDRRNVVRLIWMAIITAVCYTAFILIPSGNYRLAAFLGGLYFLSTDWLVVYLLLFTVAYTRVEPPSRLPKRIIGLLAGLDSISLVVNTFTHHMFELEAAVDDRLNLDYWNIQLKPAHYVHRIFVYAIVMYNLVVLAYRLVKAPSMYKKRYAGILIQLVGVAGLNIMCSAMDAKFDYSVILYASMAISICYFTLYASPKALLEKMHSTIVGDSVIGFIAYDDGGHCIGVNAVAEKFFTDSGDINEIAETYLDQWETEHKGNDARIIGEERTIMRDGEKMYIYVTYQRFMDEKDRELGSCFQFEDRTEVVRKFMEEQYRITHDMLTGLLNRNAFEEEAGKMLAGVQEPYYMVCSNIKDFKLVNELYGADVGDQLLIAQAGMISEALDEKSVTARIFADKFCMLMPKARFHEEEVYEQIEALRDLNLVSSFKLHYYIGVYEIRDVTEPVWTMYDKAIMAIDTIRGNYGQSICFYQDELLEHIMKEKEVLGEFDDAIAGKQFHMFLQPQIANDNSIVGAEALVRWIHPEKGMVSPGLFIPTLEKAGLIHKLDLYMWESAARKLEEWKKCGMEKYSISVNISTKDFYYLDICDTFRELAKRYDFDIKKLKLEITESALMENIQENMKTLDGLHALGYEIEIDDFGSGYSSLGMLKDIHADILKIDMIFLQETKNVKRSTTILKNIITMSKELGMPVITEGVETKEQVDFLMKVGCDMFQGFYFARPMHVEHFEEQYCGELTA
ncbi:MAG: EAL domain-containing protein [Lachnospiraceae bacterium]|nr:EAL domain-containing protein [Lachnospiraceae bacterium]MCM1239835.1 EAL domain-containing protein [Lachnospiraceae bacterium]MCM1343693.1 EAL domain-containing protein [Muribaculaceae bacterium]MCM1410209.1 EAL domain-containing protein [Lachnospiraceae bacterium]